MIKISVIIPIYNAEKYLQRCLDSLMNQTLKDMEFICINDGSTDSSLEILKNYSKQDKRFLIINQENIGVSCARNNGLTVAKGEYIGFVDADDYIDINFYEKLYSLASEKSADIACAGIIRERNKKKSIILLDYKKVLIETNVKNKYELAGLPTHCYVWNKIYRHKVLLENDLKFINGLVYEDMPFSSDIIEKSGKLITVPDVFYHYTKNKNSIIKTSNDKNRADKIRLKQYLIKKCREYNVKLQNSDNLISKIDYLFCGIKILKIYKYRATKKYFLFGLVPIFTEREYV